MQIYLVATTDLAAGREAELSRLLHSLECQPAAIRECIRLILVLQNANEGELRDVTSFPAFAETIVVPSSVSLSRARNIGLQRLLQKDALGPDAIVGFPDDDCWYTSDFLGEIARHFASNTALGLWFCDFGSNPATSAWLGVKSRPAGSRDVVRKVASITMFVRGTVARSVGSFDEMLGVGAAIPGGEDTDFAIRAYLKSTSAEVMTGQLVGHRDRGAAYRTGYYAGSLCALSKHAPRRGGIAAELVRKLFVGLVLSVSRKMPVSDFLTAIRAAYSGFGNNRGAA